MNKLILNLRRALVHYEECIDVDAAGQITASALMKLSVVCEDVQKECNKMIEAICE